jgi:hypothetical protein
VFMNTGGSNCSLIFVKLNISALALAIVYKFQKVKTCNTLNKKRHIFYPN